MKVKDYKGIEDYMKKKNMFKDLSSYNQIDKKKRKLKGTIICLAKGCDNYLYKNQSPCDSRYCVDCF